VTYEHLYTTSLTEVKATILAGWNFEGIGWQAPSQGAPVYRMYNPAIRQHLYTTDMNEYRTNAGRGWKQEGVVFYSDGPNTVGRQYNPALQVHLYDVLPSTEWNVLPTRGWTHDSARAYLRALSGGDSKYMTSQIASWMRGVTVSTPTSYKNENMNIQLYDQNYAGETVHFADVTINNPMMLKTYVAPNSFNPNYSGNNNGKYSTANPSPNWLSITSMASSRNSILAINADFEGYRSGNGYDIRGGGVVQNWDTRYLLSQSYAALVYGKDGTMSAPDQRSNTLNLSQTQHVWSFGPLLSVGTRVNVGSQDEVQGTPWAPTGAPRTIVGYLSKNHFLIAVTDGRGYGNGGLTLYQSAQLMVSKGVAFSYNMDGGGSSEMVFQGRIVNQLNGAERPNSDILYFGN
jgi:exopolysaccharide biosynthesis protein